MTAFPRKRGRKEISATHVEKRAV